jgi:glycosyltransferase involved in cell wall biosynthesis
MKIGIDVGALCGPRLGNYIFTENLIKGLMKYDKKNTYNLLSFCSKPTRLKLNNNFKYKVLLPKTKWMSLRISFEEKINKSDVFLALNQAIPQTKAKIISFSHGLSFIKYKNLYSKDYSRLKNQLDNMIKKSRYVIVSSTKIKKQLVSYGAKNKQVKVINFGIPYDMLKTETRKLEKYFLFVGTNQLIKNIDFIIESFKKFSQSKKDYKLILVLDSKIDLKDKNIVSIANLSRKKLKKLYSNATAYLSASYYESFNFPVLEALSQKCPIIALKSSVIPEMQKYVNTANNIDQFITFMKKLSNKPTSPIDLKELKNKFSWQSFVKQLYSLY